MIEVGANPEITRFKGLGEISPDEFRHFIGAQIRLEPVILKKHSDIPETLSFYMGKNTPERQVFIIDNLRIEADLVDATPEIDLFEELVKETQVEEEQV